jgi:predicted phage tail protein
LLITIQFHKSLQKFTGVESHSLNIDKLSSIKDALVALFPKLRLYIYQISNGLVKENLSLVASDGTVLGRKEYFKDEVDHSAFTLVPLVIGGSGKNASILTIAMGVALITAGVIFANPALVFQGFALTMAGLIGLSTKPPEENTQRRGNDLFEAIDNTTSPNTPIPLIYGMPRVGGQIISAHIETMSHGESDIIFVRDLFYQIESEIEKQENYVPPVPEIVETPTNAEEGVSEGVGGLGGSQEEIGEA